jgi:hypothetical protein
LPEEGNAATHTSPAASNQEIMAMEPQHGTEEIGDAISNIARKGKKRQRAFSSGARSEALIYIVLLH